MGGSASGTRRCRAACGRSSPSSERGAAVAVALLVVAVAGTAAQVGSVGAGDGKAAGIEGSEQVQEAGCNRGTGSRVHYMYTSCEVHPLACDMLWCMPTSL